MPADSTFEQRRIARRVADAYFRAHPAAPRDNRAMLRSQGYRSGPMVSQLEDVFWVRGSKV